jgi:hypothetical protein
MSGRTVVTVFQVDKMKISERILELIETGGSRPAGIIKALTGESYLTDDIHAALAELFSSKIIVSRNGFISIRTTSPDEDSTPDPPSK